jgi:hypothetical protein
MHPKWCLLPIIVRCADPPVPTLTLRSPNVTMGAVFTIDVTFSSGVTNLLPSAILVTCGASHEPTWSQALCTPLHAKPCVVQAEPHPALGLLLVNVSLQCLP